MPAPALDRPLAELARGEQQVILVCEDEASIRALLCDVLRGHGYDVHATGSPIEALALGEALGARLSLLFTDVIMPEMNGPQLAAALLAKLPGLQVLYMSGYTAGLLADLRRLAARVQPFESILADRLQHREPGLPRGIVLRLDQAL